MKINKLQKGFTIIELLIATAIFSLVLIIFLAAFIKIGDMFYKGVNMANTQEAARGALDSITSDIRFSRGTPTYIPPVAGKGWFCIGLHRYKFALGQQVGDPSTPYGLVREDIGGSGCPDPGLSPGVNPIELLNNRMQLNRMDIRFCGTGACTVSMLIVFYGSDNTVLVPSPTDANATCSGNLSTAQFCATADYTSTVINQIN